MEQASLKARPSLRLTRLYPVAPKKVWQAWTDPQALKRWWGPGGADGVSVAELDVRVGGRFRFVLRDPEGEYHDIRGVYLEVVPNRKLVFTFAWEEDGERNLDTLVTVTFADEGKTRMTFRHEPFETVQERDGHGWNSTFDRLADHLAHQSAG